MPCSAYVVLKQLGSVALGELTSVTQGTTFRLSHLPTAPVSRSRQALSLTQTSEEMRTFAGKISLDIRRTNSFTNLFYFLVSKHLERLLR